MQQIPWGVEKRLQFIEMCLFWFGKINRGDIIKKFGVSVPQASNDLTRYQEVAQKNVAYDRSKKRYVATDDFRPLFYTPDIEHFLSQILSVAEERSVNDDFWLVFTPNVVAMPVLHRYIDVEVLRALVYAIYNQQAIEVFYQSLRPDKPEPDWRWISPHAFQNDGFRWHVRAYCHNEMRFKDFKLSRIFEVSGFGKQAATAKSDRFWWEYFDAILIPNTALSPSQRTAIARQYRMHDGKLSVSVRKAVLYYFKKWLHLDLSEALNLPQESPLIVENRGEFEKALVEASSEPIY